MLKTMCLALIMSATIANLYAPPPIEITPVVQPPRRSKSLPPNKVIKFLNEDLWAIKAYLKQCYEHNNAKLCATADPDLNEAVKLPPITIVFRITF